MLYLRSQDSNGDADAERLPLAEPTVVSLERALLACGGASRERELSAAVARDPGLAAWLVRLALSGRAGVIHTTDDADDAVAWLAPRLEMELASALTRDEAEINRQSGGSADSELRLLTLAKRLAEYERAIGDFNARLEREKLEAMKELAYGASHEINNPLANIAARAQTLLPDESDPERRRKLTAIHRQAMRAHEMIADLMLFARPPKLQRNPCDITRVARQVVDELGERASEQGTQLGCDPGEQPLVLNADATQVAVAVQALIMNALEAIGAGGRVHLRVQRIEIEGAPWGEISVLDDGPGIAEEIRPHIFDPFFSGREAGRGLGFGLSKCWRIVTDHGGRVAVRQPAGGGAEFAIAIPMSLPPGAAPAAGYAG